MKKRLFAIGIFLLCLTGCGVQEPLATTETTVETEPTQPPGYYVQGSEVEESTDGALRLYTLPEKAHPMIATMGENLVLILEGEQPELLLLRGEEAIPEVRVPLPESYVPGVDSFCVTHYGVVYYDSGAGEMVYLDPQLQETKRIQLPETMVGQPVLSESGNDIFYSTGTQIFGIDAQQGTTRPVRTFACKQAILNACEFEGKLITCVLEYESGGKELVYISGETGETLSKDQGEMHLTSRGTRYYAHRVDGTIEQNLVGTWDSEPMVLSGLEGQLEPVLSLSGVVSWKQEEDSGFRLTFRQLEFENGTAGTAAPNGTVFCSVAGSPAAFLGHDGRLWFLCVDGNTGEQALLRWDIVRSAEEVAESCMSPLYTADEPDEEGLDACQERVDSLNTSYGVRIRIWKEAAKYFNTEALEVEYQPQAIHAVLDALEPVLGQFPEKFLANCVNDRIRICIVRSVDGEVKGTQYWNDGDAFIVLSAGGDIPNDFLKGLGYLVDSHVLGNSPNYDYWNETNPEGFVYGDAATYSPEYLTGETCAFVDENSMNSVKEDRCRIFVEALRPDNGELFQSPVMQEKLRQICLAIRDAWRLERKSDIYTWEQYLQESIAYQG